MDLCADGTHGPFPSTGNRSLRQGDPKNVTFPRSGIGARTAALPYRPLNAAPVRCNDTYEKARHGPTSVASDTLLLPLRRRVSHVREQRKAEKEESAPVARLLHITGCPIPITFTSSSTMRRARTGRKCAFSTNSRPLSPILLRRSRSARRSSIAATRASSCSGGITRAHHPTVRPAFARLPARCR